jgi:poly(3-hydroxybutyrate) depolymerase
MSGDEMYRMTGYQQLADREKFVAVFPDGGGLSPWNVGRGVNGWGAGVAANHNDQAFIDEIIKFVEADQCLDRAHMFVSGFSMGGYFSNEIGCLRNDIAGIGPHSGGSHDLTSCPGKVKPVIIFHGDADWLIYYPNGQETRDRWVKRNGCSSLSDKVKVKNGTCEYYRNCVPGGQVAMCTFSGLGHAWAGGNGGLFGDPNYENAAGLGWAFFKKYGW